MPGTIPAHTRWFIATGINKVHRFTFSCSITGVSSQLASFQTSALGAIRWRKYKLERRPDGSHIAKAQALAKLLHVTSTRDPTNNRGRPSTVGRNKRLPLQSQTFYRIRQQILCPTPPIPQKCLSTLQISPCPRPRHPLMVLLPLVLASSPT